MKKVISIILSVIMLLSIVPITASAGTYSGTCGDNLTWTYDTSTYTLTISGTGAMDDYDSNNRPWESYKNKIKEIIITDGVTSIGYFAFCNCNSLSSVTIGNDVKEIGVYAFGFCTNLSSVEIGNNVKKIDLNAFRDCTSLTSITIPDSIKLIDAFAFEDCTSLTYIILPDTVEFIGCNAFYNTAFYNNSSNWDNDVIYIDNILLDVKPIISGQCTIKENIRLISEFAFRDCKNLEYITVDEENKYFYSDESGVLFNKDKTILIHYPAGNTRSSYVIPYGVSLITRASFEYSKNLTNIRIPDSVTLIEYYAFDKCEKLTDVYYTGSTENWNKIAISSFNEDLLNANIYYNYCKHSFGNWIIEKEQNCLTDGLRKRVCLGCGKIEESPISATGHSYESTVTPPICTEKGFKTYTCSVCNDTYVDNYVDATGHKYNEVVTQPTCEQNGYTTCTCECGDTYIANIISATGHSDNDNEGYCDVCDELLCDHDCHRGGFAGFFWKISNFFNRLFGTNKYCECGVAHY